MPPALIPCPICGRGMDRSRTVCAFCTQAGHTPPAGDPTILEAALAAPVGPQRVCGQCGAPMGVNDRKCGSCELRREKRAGLSSTLVPFLVGVAIPIVGVIFGLIRAFSDDPEGKKEAGYFFGGAITGFFGALLGIYLLLFFSHP